MHSTSDIFISLVHPFYGTECVVQHGTWLMVWMDLSAMGICRPFTHMFKLSGLMFLLKAFILNSLSLWYYLCWSLLLCACWRMCEVLWWYCLRSLWCNFILQRRWYWMDLYVRKEFCSYKNLGIVWCSCDVAVCLLAG